MVFHNWLHGLAAGFVPPTPSQNFENCLIVGCSEELGSVSVQNRTWRRDLMIPSNR